MVKIYIGGIRKGSKESDLRALFEEFGKVTECSIVTKYGFVHMENEEDARKAISRLNRIEFDGARIQVELSHDNNRKPRGHNRDSGRGSRDRSRSRNERRDYPPRRDGRYGNEGHWGREYPPYRQNDNFDRRPYDVPYYDDRTGNRGSYYNDTYPGYDYAPDPRSPRKSGPPNRYDNYPGYGSYGDYGYPSDRAAPPPVRNDRYENRMPPTVYDYANGRAPVNYGSGAPPYEYGRYGNRFSQPQKNDFPQGYGR